MTTPRSRPLRYLGFLKVRAGDWHIGHQMLEESLALARRGGDVLDEAEATFFLADACYRNGDYERALKSILRTKELRELGGFPLHEEATLHNIGICYLALGQDDEAEVWLRKALSAAEQPDAERGSRGWALGQLGFIRLRRGDLDTAQDLLERALAAIRDSGNGNGELEAVIGLRCVRVRIAKGQLAAAEQLLTDIETSNATTPTAEVQDALQNTKAELAIARGDAETARRLFETVVERASRGHDQMELDRARAGLAKTGQMPTEDKN